MRAIVFGSTGFIGSHVVEQLVLAGHNVTAVVRASINIDFLKSLNIHIKKVDFSNIESIKDEIEGHDVVYNCIASTKLHQPLNKHREIDVDLTEKIVKAASSAGVTRFIQLSTVLVYGFDNRTGIIDESFPTQPEYSFQKVAIEREEKVKQSALKYGLEYVILRPANTIGQRDTKSFFAKMYEAHLKNKYPLIGNGEASFSCVDTRDIGRAMIWLSQLEQANGQTYLLKGFDISWIELKEMIDKVRGFDARTIRISENIALLLGYLFEKLTPYSKEPLLTPFMVKSVSTDCVYSDSKLKNSGFKTIYTFEQSILDAITDLNKRVGHIA